jgi:predicted  nucleic acid-binding Zn-ribbon protein
MSDLSTLRLQQLSSLGIAVNPQWTVGTLRPEDLYALVLDCARRIAQPPPKSSENNARQVYDAAMAAWAAEAPGGDFATNIAAARRELKVAPAKLPAGTKERFDACSSLAQTVLREAFGCTSDALDYSAFMYPTEEKSGELLSFMAQRLGEHGDRLRAAEANVAAEATAAHAAAQAAAGDARSVNGRVRQALLFLRPGAMPLPGAGAFARPEETLGFRVAPGTSMSEALAALHARREGAGDAFPSILAANALARLKSVRFTASGHADEAADLVQPVQDSNDAAAANGAAAFDAYGSLADVQPRRAADRHRAAAAAREELANKEASLAQMASDVAATQRARESEQESLKDRLASVKAAAGEFKGQIKAAKAAITACEAKMAEIDAARVAFEAAREAQLAELQREADWIAAVAEGRGDTVLEELRGAVAAAQDERTGAKADLDQRSAKLLAKRAEIEARIEAVGQSSQQVISEIHAACRVLKREMKAKALEVEALERDVGAAPRSAGERAHLARAIYEVTVRRHMKQQLEIDAIVRDITSGEHRISAVQRSVAEQYKVLESEMFAAAKANAQLREIFGPLVSIRGEYVKLIGNIQQRGKLRKEAHDVESRLGQIRRACEGLDATAIAGDLQMAQDACASMEEQLAALGADASADI